MDKVEIIKETTNNIVEVLNESQCTAVIVISMLACVAILFLATAVSFSKDPSKYSMSNRSVAIAIITVLSPVWGILVGWAIETNFIEEKAITGEEHIYEIYVPDDVPLNEFLDKYTVLSRDGNNYTVREVLMYDEPREISKHDKSADVKKEAQ